MIRLLINEVAKSRGLNQSQLQIKAGVTPQLLNRYWNNHTQSVAFEPLEKIALALGVQPGELIATDIEIMRNGGMKRWQAVNKQREAEDTQPRKAAGGQEQ